MTKQYMTRDLYKGSWKDVLAKYEAMSNKNKNEKPKFVQEGSILKNIDKIVEIVRRPDTHINGGDKGGYNTMDSVNVNMVAPVKQNVASVKHYPVFEIVEVRTIRRACPTADDVIKWRGTVSDEEMDKHVVQISYVITQVTQLIPTNEELSPSPPRDPPTPVPVTQNQQIVTPHSETVISTQIPDVITTKVDVTPPKKVTQNTKSTRQHTSRKVAPITVA